MALNTFMINNKYVFKRRDAERAGKITSIRHDYEVWLKAELKQRDPVLGIQIDHQWKYYKIGDLYSFTITKRIVNNTYKTKFLDSPSSNRFYDDSLEVRLGGAVQTLGG